MFRHLHRSEAPSAVHFFGVSPAVDLSDGGPFTASRGSCPGADAKFFAGFMAKNFVAGASHPGQMEREGVTSAPRKVHSGKQAAGVAAGGRTAAPSGAGEWHRTEQRAGTRRNDVKRGLRNGVAPYIPAVFCRDARSAGHGATEAARPERSLQARGFHASDRSDSPKPRQRVRRRLAGAPAAARRSRA